MIQTFLTSKPLMDPHRFRHYPPRLPVTSSPGLTRRAVPPKGWMLGCFWMVLLMEEIRRSPFEVAWKKIAKLDLAAHPHTVPSKVFVLRRGGRHWGGGGGELHIFPKFPHRFSTEMAETLCIFRLTRWGWWEILSHEAGIERRNLSAFATITANYQKFIYESKLDAFKRYSSMVINTIWPNHNISPT